LDIGCGFAFESEMFQRKYGTALYLLDGEYRPLPKKSRDIGYGSVEDFTFYHPRDTLEESFRIRGLKYSFIDAQDLELASDLKFDLVYSFLSCGFHYPAETYADFIREHTNPDSVVLLDVRKEFSWRVPGAIVENTPKYNKIMVDMEDWCGSNPE
jgi:SAM-dependent methyltransferase